MLILLMGGSASSGIATLSIRGGCDKCHCASQTSLKEFLLRHAVLCGERVELLEPFGVNIEKNRLSFFDVNRVETGPVGKFPRMSLPGREWSYPAWGGKGLSN